MKKVVSAAAPEAARPAAANEADIVRVGFGGYNIIEDDLLLRSLDHASPSATTVIFSGAKITDSVLRIVGDWMQDHPNIKSLIIERSTNFYSIKGMRKFCYALKYNGLEQVNAEGFIDPVLASQIVEEYSRLQHVISMKDAAAAASAASGVKDPNELELGFGKQNPVSKEQLNYSLSQAKPDVSTFKFWNCTITDLLLDVLGPWIKDHKNIKSFAVNNCEKDYTADGMNRFCEALKVNGLARVDADGFIDNDVASEIVGKFLEMHPEHG